MSARYSVYIKGKPFVMRNDIEYTRKNVVAFEDRVRVEARRDEFYGGEMSRSYRSHIMTNPTWGTLCRVFQSQMQTTRDYHHAFLEGARIVRREVDTNGQSYAVVELLLGS